MTYSPSIPYAWEAPEVSSGAWHTPAIAQQAKLYLDWLVNYLELMAKSEDNKQLDPYKGDWGESQVRAAEALILDGVIPLQGDPRELTLPFIQQYYESVQSYQEMYPDETPTSLTPEEAAYMESQTAYNQARVQEILNDISSTGQMTEYQQAQLDLAFQELEFSMQQAGIGTQQDWAELELAKQQLAIQQEQFAQEMALEQQRLGLEQEQMQLDWNEYLADLQAHPADFIERWYAERLPPGGEMPGFITNAGYNWSQEAGWQPPSGTTSPAQELVETAAERPPQPDEGSWVWNENTGQWERPTGATGIGIDPVTGEITQPGLTTALPVPGSATAIVAGMNAPEKVSTVTPEGWQMYSDEALETGVLQPEETNPVRQWLATNVGQLSPDEIDWWLRDVSLEGVWDELRAETQRRFGSFIGAGEMRDYAMKLRERDRLAEAVDREMFPEAVAAAEALAASLNIPVTEEMIYDEVKKIMGWQSSLLHQQAVEEVASIPFEQWAATTRILPWESELDIRSRYDRLMEEAAAQGLPIMESPLTARTSRNENYYLPQGIPMAPQAPEQQLASAYAPIVQQAAQISPIAAWSPMAAAQPTAVAPTQPFSGWQTTPYAQNIQETLNKWGGATF